MTLARQWAIVGGVVVLLGTGVLAATHFLAAELFPVSVGSKAPAFSAPTIQEYDSSGRTTAPPDARAQHSLADYRGQVLLINVWATWCQPCIVEMPAIEKLHQVYGPKGLKVVAISVDDQGMDDAIRSFVREHRLTFTVLHDEHGHVQHDYQATGYPETFVVGRDGTIRKKVIGAMNWNSASNRALVAQLLAEPAPAE